MFKVVFGVMESSQKRIYVIKYSIKILLKMSLSLSQTHTILYRYGWLIFFNIIQFLIHRHNKYNVVNYKTLVYYIDRARSSYIHHKYVTCLS